MVDLLTNQAALGALEEDLLAACILHKHFTEAFIKVSPSFASQRLNFYDDYALGQKK